MAVYYPEHFQAICDRLGYSLKKAYLFDFADKRTFMIRLKVFFLNSQQRLVQGYLAP